MKSSFESCLPFGFPRAAALASVLTATLVLGACTTFHTTSHEAPIEVNLVALNDFHGNLESSTFKYTSAGDQIEHTAQAGGIDTLAAALQAWRKEDPDLLLVGAGDLVGASPAISSMWADEPSIVVMNRLGLRASAVGNHEFDQGRQELLRQQNGGCVSPRPDKACKFNPDYEGAKFTYLAANVIDKTTGKPFLPAYRIEQVHGVKIAFIGAVLKDTASMVMASGIAGLDFADEAESINRVLPELRAQGVGVYVVLIHQGGTTQDYFDQPDCDHLKGPIVDVARHLDPAIRLVVSGHSHTGYTCEVDGRMVTQAAMGGHLLTRIKLTVDSSGKAVRGVSAHNVVMLPDAYLADAGMSAYLNSVEQRSKDALARPIAHIGVATVGRDRNSMGESALGDLVADSVLAATERMGVQIAFMNNGGIRKDLEAGENRVVSYGQAQIVLPFDNTLVAMTLTGAQIRQLLEQQWHKEDGEEGNLLQVSDGFHYRWDGKRPVGQRVIPGSVSLHGVALDDAKTYRVAANRFLAEGGDNFPMFARGDGRLDSGIHDLDAFITYLTTRDQAGTPAGKALPDGRIEHIE